MNENGKLKVLNISNIKKKANAQLPDCMNIKISAKHELFINQFLIFILLLLTSSVLICIATKALFRQSPEKYQRK